MTSLKAVSPNRVTFWGLGIRALAYEFGGTKFSPECHSSAINWAPESMERIRLVWAYFCACTHGTPKCGCHSSGHWSHSILGSFLCTWFWGLVARQAWKGLQMLKGGWLRCLTLGYTGKGLAKEKLACRPWYTHVARLLSFRRVTKAKRVFTLLIRFLL